MKKHSRFEVARKLLLFWCLFIGLGAVWGAAMMLLKPDGSILQMQTLLPYFQVLPFADALFQNFTFPGVALLCVNGVPNLIAAWLLLKRRHGGIVCGGVFGVTLMLWIVIQFIIFPRNPLSISYFIFGAAQAATGYAAWVFDRQERFIVRAEDYPNIGAKPDRLVVYFSRMGYVKRAALEEAQRTGAEVYEVKCAERTEGTLGFWWCGRFGMHRWPMPIVEPEIDWDRYAHVTFCSSIWVFHLGAPMRAFCQAARGKIKSADYLLVHFSPFDYPNAAREMDDLLGVTARSAVSVRCRQGRYGAPKRLRG